MMVHSNELRLVSGSVAMSLELRGESSWNDIDSLRSAVRVMAVGRRAAARGRSDCGRGAGSLGRAR